jgi:hypothetical protein
MFNDPTRCYYRRPDGTLASFLQEEGFPQGDPLSPFWSCLVLALLFNPLNEALATRANDRLQRSIFGDDGRGTRSANMAYFDDSLLFPAYEDLSFILAFILQKGPALGIFLSIPKTKLLTLPSNTPSTVLTASQTAHLTTALTILNGSSSIVTGGIRYLGQPLGDKNFANAYLSTAASSFQQAADRLYQ